MGKIEIMKYCEQNVRRFCEKTSSNSYTYTVKGIINSELLLVCSVIKMLECTLIIESGRARGQNTKVLSDFFGASDYNIHSIEFNKFTEDSIIAMKRLKGYKNLKLHFWDSFKIAQNLSERDCCVLIDGSKGRGAIRLTIDLLTNPLVKVVFIHDCYKGSDTRKLLEEIFNYTFFCNHKTFSDKNSFVHNKCGEIINAYKNYRYSSPYIREGQRGDSYFATLGVIFNGDNAINKEVYDKYFKNENQNKVKFIAIEGIARKLFDEVKRGTVIPFCSVCTTSQNYVYLMPREVGNGKE